MRSPAAQEKPAAEDWHPADIVAAVRKAGWSLRQLSLHHGYADGATLKHALKAPYPKAERLIAEAIGVPPRQIWPSRYPEKDTSGAGAPTGDEAGRKVA